MPTKEEIRARMKAKRKAVSAKRRELTSAAICERLLLKCRGARLVAAYEPLPTEIDLKNFFAKFAGEIVVPVKTGGHWEMPRAAEVDVWLCPGLAFTPDGRRIGFGGGWYDRFLAAAKPSAKKYGVAYRFQLFDDLPQEPFDLRLDEIVAEGVSLDYERELGGTVIGVDEAGRGPLVGGVYAAAVTAPLDLAEKLLHGEWRAINDSKQLTEAKREELAAVIKATAGVTWSVASASAAEIDEHNILGATHLAMRRAVKSVTDALAGQSDGEIKPPAVLVDGLPVKTLFNSRNLVKGDAKSIFIAAASILAKTARDADCLRLERLYPGYGIAKHKGYPTAEHYAALARLGPCAEHRRSFRLDA